MLCVLNGVGTSQLFHRLRAWERGDLRHTWLAFAAQPESHVDIWTALWYTGAVRRFQSCRKVCIMSQFKGIIGPMRPPFLILAPCCVVLGLAVALWLQGSVDVWHAILAFVGGIAAHISVNALNEYSDFQSGLDFRTPRTPFSGGSGTLPAYPSMARAARTTGVVSSGLVVLIGLFFWGVWGWSIVPLGLLGLVVIISYTDWLTHNWLLCLIAPGLGFGPLMVMGTFFALTGTYNWSAFVASLVPFFLVSNLLLLNQFPDAEADKTIGRKHLLIVAGKRTSALVLGSFYLLAYLSLVIGVLLSLLPPASLLGLLTLPLAIRAFLRAYQHPDDLALLVPALSWNVLVTLLTPVLTALGLFLTL